MSGGQRSAIAVSTIARHGRLRTPSPVAAVAKFVLAAIAVLLVSVVAVAGYAILDLTGSAKPSVHLAGEPTDPIPNIAALKGGVNILIAATDTRTDQGGAYGTTDDSAGVGNNDVTMLLHLSQDHSHATVVSFPRDLIIPIPECQDNDGNTIDAQDAQQLNTTLSEGGEKNGLSCTVATIKQLTGLDIPFAGVITFDGVVAMSNAIGGVQVCIANGIDDPDTELNLPPGPVTLQGSQAAQFLRTRHGVGDGSDLGRISNQQVFLSALVRKIKDAGTLGNPAKVWALANATVKNVQLSDQLDNPTTLYQIALALKGLSFDNILFVQYPVVDDPDNDNRVIPDEDAADAVNAALLADQPLQLLGGTGDGAVVSTDSPTPPPSTADSGTPQVPPATQPPSGSTGGTSVPTPTGPVQLPDSVHGQTAATQTCSNGNG